MKLLVAATGGTIASLPDPETGAVTYREDIAAAGVGAWAAAGAVVIAATVAKGVALAAGSARRGEAGTRGGASPGVTSAVAKGEAGSASGVTGAVFFVHGVAAFASPRAD